jgi:hypothetical protein
MARIMKGADPVGAMLKYASWQHKRRIAGRRGMCVQCIAFVQQPWYAWQQNNALIMSMDDTVVETVGFSAIARGSFL